jgi:hypothetical protein
MPHIDSINPFASHGHETHGFLANMLMHGRDEALLKAPPALRAGFEEIDTSQLPAFDPRSFAPEISLAWNLETDEIRELGRNLTRDEARARGRPGELVMTMDVAGITPISVVIWDYKTGFRAVTHPSKNWQLQSYGVGGWKRWKRDLVQQGVIRVPPGMRPSFVSAEMTKADLELHEYAIRDLLDERARIKKLAKAGKWDEIPRPVENDEWCRYCPAQNSCPAKIAGLVKLRDQDLSLESKIANLEPRQKGELYNQLDMVRRTAERMMSVIEGMALSEPIPLDDDGKVLGERQVIKETILPELAREPLTEAIGADATAALWREGVKRRETLSQGDFKSFIGRHILPLVPNAKKGDVFDKLMAHLRAAGAVAPRVEYRIEAHTPGRSLPAQPLELPEGTGEDLP